MLDDEDGPACCWSTVPPSLRDLAARRELTPTAVRNVHAFFARFTGNSPKEKASVQQIKDDAGSIEQSEANQQTPDGV